MKNIDFKKALPILAAIVVFLIVTMIYFSPLIEGKRLYQSDVINHQGASKEIVDFREKTGQEALWTNSMFGGMPAYQISVKYTSNVIGFFDRIFQLGLPGPANFVFLYFLGFFILLMVMKVDPWLSVAGALAFGLSSFFFLILDAGHNSQAHAIGYMAPVIAGIILTFRKKYLWGGVFTAFFLSLELYSNHPQITYYLMIIGVILGIAQLVESIRSKEYIHYLKSIGIIGVAALFALLTNITSLWATYEYGKYTIRGKSELTSDKANKTAGLDRDYVTQWSYGKAETMTLLIPDFYGGSSSQKIDEGSKIVEAMKANNVPEQNINDFIKQKLPFLYWGDQPFTSGPVYVGAIIFFLFFLGLILVRGAVKWWLLAATLLAILLSWGHNFMGFTNFFLDHVPGYNKFRAVTMTLVIAEFAMPLLGFLALKEIFDNHNDKKRLFNGLIIALIFTGGLALVFALVPDLFLNFTSLQDANMKQQYQFPDWFMQGVRDERLRLVRMDAIRALTFILLSAGLIWAVIFNKLKKQYLPFILMGLILADMVTVNKRYVNNDGFVNKSQAVNPFEPSASDQEIMKDTTLDYRVMNLAANTFNDASTSYFHKSIGGYHGAKLRRYQELIENQINKQNIQVLNMLNTRYFIVNDKARGETVQFNPGACGNAWFVKNYNVVENPDAEIKALDRFNPGDTAIVDKRFNDELKSYVPGRDSTDFIRMKDYQPNHLTYQYRSKSNGLAVFAEIYYPEGWNATVDGKPVPYFRANYVLRSMVLPAGEHQLEFIFHPNVYFVGEKISMISSIILLLLILGAAGWEIRKRFMPKA